MVGFGIDGGGTHSRMSVFDLQTGEELARVMGKSTNRYSVTKEEVENHIAELFDKAGFPREAYGCGCLGSAGLSRAEDIGFFQKLFERVLKDCPVYLCNDGETLLVGSLQSTQGYSLIGGTGSLAIGRMTDGRVVRAGGMGYMLGDEGSALWISWQAIKRSLRSMEGRDLPTGMLPKLQAHFSLSAPSDFVDMMHRRFQKSIIATASKLVLMEAEAGDPLAVDIGQQAVKELCLLVQSVSEQLPMDGGRVALSGGLIENSEWLRVRLLDRIKSTLPHIDPVVTTGDALKGACMLSKTMNQHSSMVKWQE